MEPCICRTNMHPQCLAAIEDRVVSLTARLATAEALLKEAGQIVLIVCVGGPTCKCSARLFAARIDAALGGAKADDHGPSGGKA